MTTAPKLKSLSSHSHIIVIGPCFWVGVTESFKPADPQNIPRSSLLISYPKTLEALNMILTVDTKNPA